MVHLEPDGRSPFATDISMIVLVALAVALRFVAKVKAKAPMKLADWFIVFATAGFMAMNGAFLQGLLGSGGSLEFRQMDLRELANIYKYLYIVQAIFIVDISLIRFSIMAFYYEIFSLSAPFRNSMRVLGVLSLIWLIVILFVNLFQCSPVEAAWDTTSLIFSDKTCINYGRFVIGYETTNMALDLGIIASCVCVVRKLQLSKAKVAVICTIIALGGFVSVMCLVRIYYFTQFNWEYSLLTIQLGPLLEWSDAQLAVAVVCACIPCYGPLLPIKKATTRLERWFGSTEPYKPAFKVQRLDWSPKGSVSSEAFYGQMKELPALPDDDSAKWLDYNYDPPIERKYSYV